MDFLLPSAICQEDYNLAYLRKVLLCFAELSISTVLDVGANTGQFASLIRNSGYSGEIISFEPLLSERRELEKLAASDSSWSVLPFALGSKNGRETLHRTENSLMSSLRRPSERQIAAQATSKIIGEEIVEVRRLDDLVPQLTISNLSKTFLKLDTQGFDAEVLRGATTLLPEVPLIQVELPLTSVYDGAADPLSILQLLGQFGYEAISFHPVLFDSRNEDLLQCDALFRLRSTIGIN